MKNLTLIGLFFLLAGCASPGKKLNHLSIGMSKEQVLDIMGTPESTKAMNPREVLVYSDTERPFGAPARYTQYWVVLVDGKVFQFGQAGDFGNSSVPTQHVIIDKTNH